MRRHFEKMRQKPEHVRRRLAFYTSFTITALIFVFWLGAKVSLTGPELSGGALANESPTAPPASPFKTMQASISEAVTGIVHAIEGTDPEANTPLEVVEKY